MNSRGFISGFIYISLSPGSYAGWKERSSRGALLRCSTLVLRVCALYCSTILSVPRTPKPPRTFRTARKKYFGLHSDAELWVPHIWHSWGCAESSESQSGSNRISRLAATKFWRPILVFGPPQNMENIGADELNIQNRRHYNIICRACKGENDDYAEDRIL